MKPVVLLVCLAVILSAAATAQPVRTDVRPADDPFFLSPDTHSNLSGFTSDITINPNNTCFAGVPDSTFQGGQDVGFNVFWDDTVQETFQTYDVTWGVQNPSGGVIVLFQGPCIYDLSGFPPGTPVSFCCVLSVQNIPSVNVSTGWGSRVTRGDTLQGALGVITIVP